MRFRSVQQAAGTAFGRKKGSKIKFWESATEVRGEGSCEDG